MRRRKFLIAVVLMLAVAVFGLFAARSIYAQMNKADSDAAPVESVKAAATGSPFAPSDPRATGQMRATTQEMRKVARRLQADQRRGVNLNFAGVNPATAAHSPLSIRAGALATMADPATCVKSSGGLCLPDYFGVANWANSPLPLTAGSGAAAATAVVGSVTDAFGNTTLGVVTAINGGLGGTGYFYPYVTIAAPPSPCLVATCRQAVATATEVNGGIAKITLVDGGAGYCDAAGNPAAPAVTVSGVLAGTGMQKFVDILPGLCGHSPWGAAGASPGVNNLGQCIPIAQADTTTFAPPTFAASDFYRLRLEGYNQQMHSNLPAAGTRLWGYVQIDSGGAQMPVRDLLGNSVLKVGGAAVNPHQYLGPLILAVKDKPVRVLFQNSLTEDPEIPVDTTYMGAGAVSDLTNSKMASLRRSDIHLHGGNTPWISDGTPHQWITPASDPSGQPAKFGFAKGFSFQNVPDMPSKLGFTPSFTDGLGTYYWTNHQSGRLMFYHEHAYGTTRLNVYMGVAAGYLLVDPNQEHALAQASVPGAIDLTLGLAGADLAHVVPLVIQDKTFVPDSGAAGGQLAATDPTWDVSKFGGAGNLWFPHVYTPNQNPYDPGGANPFGRWDYGPWFWPPQNPNTFVTAGLPQPCTSVAYPGAYLTCPGTPNPSGTPEGFMDTPVINGTAYPTLTLKQAAYRFQILSAGNDRTLNLGLYYAATAAGVVCNGAVAPSLCTEVSMVPAVPHAAALPATTVDGLLLCAQATDTSGAMLALGAIDSTTGAPLNGTGLPSGCWPTSWPTDGRDGGVPHPATAGPPFIQIGTEGGLLPAPVVIPSTPMSYEYNRRSITVLNVFTHGLTLGPAERADAIVDFSGIPSGSVLMLYNDGPAPVPAFDPRVDYYTGDPDQTSTGGAPSTIAGFGPNTRTLMQIVVNGANDNLTPFKLGATATPAAGTLAGDLPGIFASTQDQIIVPETAYPAGNGGALQDTYVPIQNNSIAYWTGGAVGSLSLIRGGSYTSTPNVLIAAPTAGTTATATATLATTGVGSVAPSGPPIVGGFGYTALPTVTFNNTGTGGTGAVSTAILGNQGVRSIAVTNGGSGYNTAPVVNIVCTNPAPNPAPTVCATAHATIGSNKKVNAILVDNPGAGYTAVPGVSFTNTGTGGTGATASASLGFRVTGFAVNNAGSGYNTAPTVTVAAPPTSNCVPTTICRQATATAFLAPRPIASLALTNGGSGYVSTPAVSIGCPPLVTCGSGGVAAAVAPASPLLPKTIQELFTLDYGRMNATLGVELPFTNFLTQTTIPYGYVDPPTEIFKDGETQFWKITHNGVDTHFIHFHLFNVQVINRVGWDGAIKAPDANELSWKDTVRMNPLEDIVVALRPLKQPNLPWDLPNSVRPLDVTAPVGSSLPNQFTNVDPTNQPATVTNDSTNFGWEYVWHCHILGHEENDMMRAMILAVPPNAPITLGKASGGTLTWVDQSLNETGFTIQQATSAAGPWTNVATVAAAPGSGTTVTYKSATVIKSGFYYRVTANNLVGYTKTYAAPAAGYPYFSADSAALGPIQY